jgi:catalase-peroxidase
VVTPLVKAHGAADPEKYVGPEPHGASIEEMSTGLEKYL